MEPFWKEQPFTHGKFQGTKFIWPKDRLICFDEDDPTEPPRMIVPFSLDLVFLSYTTTEDNLTAIIADCIVDHITRKLAYRDTTPIISREDIKKMSAKEYFDWATNWVDTNASDRM